MGVGSSKALSRRLRYNDRHLKELDLTTLDDIDVDLEEFFDCLRQNHTVESVVLMDGFSGRLLELMLWGDFLESLASLRGLVQIEFLETSVPFNSIEYLIRNAPKLEALGMDNAFTMGSVSVESIRELADAMEGKTECALKEFVWESDFSILAREEASCLDPVVKALSTCQHLTRLCLLNITMEDLSAPLISPSAIGTLCRALPSLETLILGDCGLGDDHCDALQASLYDHPSISNLGLPRNRMGPGAFLTVRKLLQENPHIYELSMDLAKPQQEQLDLWLFLNKYVRSPLARMPSLLGTLVLRNSDSPDALYYLLQRHPELYQQA